MLRAVIEAKERRARDERRAEAQDAQRQRAFGYLITRMREAACMSQSELGRRMGTTQSSISRWESGRQTPSIHTLNVIAGVTGFDLLVGARGRGDDIDVTPDAPAIFGFKQQPRRIDPNLLVLGYVVDEEPMAELWLVADGEV